MYKVKHNPSASSITKPFRKAWLAKRMSFLDNSIVPTNDLAPSTFANSNETSISSTCCHVCQWSHHEYFPQHINFWVFYEGPPYTTWVFWAHFKRENLLDYFWFNEYIFELKKKVHLFYFEHDMTKKMHFKVWMCKKIWNEHVSL